MTYVRFAALLVIACLVFARPARADSTSSAAAEVLFREGRILFDQGKFADACDHFARSQQLDPAVGTLLNLGDCYKRINKTASAWLAYSKAVGLAKSRSDAKRAEVAENEARDLDPTLPRIRIKFAGTTPGIAILLNGEAVDPSTFASPVPVDPGEATFEASAPGRKTFYTTLDMAVGMTQTITVPVLEDTNPPSNGLATGLEIGGGVALGVALAAGTVALLKWSSVEDACPERKCPTAKALKEQSAAVPSATMFAHISTVSAIVGIAALGVGLYLDFGTTKRVAIGLDGPTAIGLRARWP